MKFCSGGMLAAIRVKMSDGENKSEQEHVRKTCYIFSIKLDVSEVSR